MNINIGRPQIVAKRRSGVIRAEKSRVILRPYIPGSEERINTIVNKILALSDEETKALLDQTFLEFSDRHRHFRESLKGNYRKIEHCLPDSDNISSDRRLLLGAYFSSEYSVEAAALFNPSIVLHPNQKDMPEGAVRFIMSFRATGEGHISSIVFRSGIIDKENSIFFDPISDYIETPRLHIDRTYNKHLFNLKLNEMGACNDVTSSLFDKLGDEFTFEMLEEKIGELASEHQLNTDRLRSAEEMARWLARSNYIVNFDSNHRISERVIFPVSENESKGIEDARFVRFTDNGSSVYYATYTAYNGMKIMPQLIKTKDFETFRIITLNGKAVQNKGMALFPRKINGKYAMLSRQDGENNHIMFSDNIHFWQESTILRTPSRPWEFVQIGNCGSPIETPEGWLSLTHGVGPMRTYS
ncbi:FIG01423360: glycoside hydrolase, partial [hydrothermal vent metagenome]